MTTTLRSGFIESFDARDWARAFVAVVQQHPEIPTDEGTMVGWFANALMRGYDAGREVPVDRRGTTPGGDSVFRLYDGWFDATITAMRMGKIQSENLEADALEEARTVLGTLARRELKP